MSDLFHISGTSPDDLEYDLSLLVSAETPEQVIELWRDHYWDDEPENCPYHTEFVAGEAPPYDLRSKMSLWRVKHDPAVVRALVWGEDSQLEHLGYIVEKV